MKKGTKKSTDNFSLRHKSTGKKSEIHSSSSIYSNDSAENPISEVDYRKLYHDLEAYTIELERQNELLLTINDVSSYEQRMSELSASNEVLRQLNVSSSKEELIESTSSFLKTYMGCDAIGIRLKDGNDYPYYHTIGFPTDFVKAECSLCSIDENGNTKLDANGNPVLECMCGQIISGRIDNLKPFFTNNGSFWTNSTTELLANTSKSELPENARNRCNIDGFESLGLFSLRFKNETFGLLQINDKQKGLFTPGKISFIENCTDMLSIALLNIQKNETIQSNYSLLKIAGETAKFGGWSVDVKENRVKWSDEVASIHGMPSGYSPLLDEGIKFYTPEYQEKIKSCVQLCATKGRNCILRC